MIDINNLGFSFGSNEFPSAKEGEEVTLITYSINFPLGKKTKMIWVNEDGKLKLEPCS